jgi:hypothetical protein
MFFVVFFFIFVFYFFQYWSLNSGLHTRYHLSHSSSLFLLIPLEMGIAFCPGQTVSHSCCITLAAVTGIAGLCYHIYLSFTETGSC